MPLSLHQKGSDETGLAVSTSILLPGSDTGKLHQSSDEAGGCRINTWTNLTPAVRPPVLHTAALPLCGHTWVLHFCKEQPLSLAQLWRGNKRRPRQDAPQGCLKLQTIYEFNQDIMNYLGLIIFSKCRWLWARSDTVCNFSVTQRGYCQAMLFTFIACFCYGGLFQISWITDFLRNKKRLQYSVFNLNNLHMYINIYFNGGCIVFVFVMASVCSYQTSRMQINWGLPSFGGNQYHDRKGVCDILRYDPWYN